MTTLSEIYGDVIYAYTREQFIKDGGLVALSGPGSEVHDEWIPKMCDEEGFRVPVGMTAEAFALTVELSPKAEEAGCDLKGRLWDVLFMLRLAISRSRSGDSPLYFELYCVTSFVKPSLTRLKCVCGPDDDGELCLTIMLPNQD